MRMAQHQYLALTGAGTGVSSGFPRPKLSRNTSDIVKGHLKGNPTTFNCTGFSSNLQEPGHNKPAVFLLKGKTSTARDVVSQLERCQRENLCRTSHYLHSRANSIEQDVRVDARLRCSQEIDKDFADGVSGRESLFPPAVFLSESRRRTLGMSTQTPFGLCGTNSPHTLRSRCSMRGDQVCPQRGGDVASHCRSGQAALLESTSSLLGHPSPSKAQTRSASKHDQRLVSPGTGGLHINDAKVICAPSQSIPKICVMPHSAQTSCVLSQSRRYCCPTLQCSPRHY